MNRLDDKDQQQQQQKNVGDTKITFKQLKEQQQLSSSLKGSKSSSKRIIGCLKDKQGPRGTNRVKFLSNLQNQDQEISQTQQRRKRMPTSFLSHRQIPPNSQIFEDKIEILRFKVKSEKDIGLSVYWHLRNDSNKLIQKDRLQLAAAKQVEVDLKIEELGNFEDIYLILELGTLNDGEGTTSSKKCKLSCIDGSRSILCSRCQS